MSKKTYKEKWEEIFYDPTHLRPLLALTLGALLLAIALSQISDGKIPFDKGWFVFPFIFALVLLGIHRIIRELLVVASLLGASWCGLSQILTQVWEPGSISPAKTSIIIAVILSWTILVALCLGRLHGGRDDD